MPKYTRGTKMKFVNNPKNLVPQYHIIPALIGAGVALGSMAVNAYSQYKTNKANESAQQSNLDYQKSVQQTTWNREDTAYQRAVSDAQKSGLSPLAVSGGSTSGAVVSTTPVTRQAMNIDASQVAQSAQAIAQQKIQQKQLNLQTQSFQEEVKNQKIQNKMKELEFQEMQKQNQRDYDLRYDIQQHTKGLDLKRLARDLDNDKEQTRQFNSRLNFDYQNKDWEKSTWKKDFEARSTQWEKEHERNRQNDYINNALKEEQYAYQSNINKYFESDKKLGTLLRVLSLIK